MGKGRGLLLVVVVKGSCYVIVYHQDDPVGFKLDIFGMNQIRYYVKDITRSFIKNYYKTKSSLINGRDYLLIKIFIFSVPLYLK